MRTLKRLIQRAKQLVSDTMYWFAMDGMFIEALGLDPEDYIVPYPNGEHGYDDLAALREITPVVWKDCE